MANKITKCLNPNCKRTSTIRGLCSSCIALAHKLVNEHKTTWDKLERAGKVKPKKRGHASAWLLSK